jgi:AcrR family transcriptional regulator
MDDLVRASGLSKGSLYWHFHSKEEVLLAVFDAFEETLFGEWDAAAEASQDAMSVLRREFVSGVQSFSEQRVFLLAWAEFLSHPAARERMAGTYTVARERLSTVIEAGRRAGSLRSGPPAERVASTLLGTVEGLWLQWLVDPDFDLEGQIEDTWELLKEGLRP